MPLTHEEAQNTFYDIHCHTLTLSHPNILSFLEGMRKNRLENFLPGLFSAGYLLDSMGNFSRMIRNLLSVMENDVGNMLLIMEDDLMGKFRDDPKEAMIRNGVLHTSFGKYRKIVLTPLLMDFGDKNLHPEEIYYKLSPSKPIMEQIYDVLEGIKMYRRERPNGIFEVYPFFGINPQNHSLELIQKLMVRLFGHYISSRKVYNDSFTHINDRTPDIHNLKSMFFAGVKLYPPLGFDPWPEDEPEELEKVRYIYEYCEKKHIPVTTHCDDQGFRTVGTLKSWKYTSPVRWRKVLENYPNLKINFAHFGMQYYRKVGIFEQKWWQKGIISLMLEYPNVYADVSFNGTKKKYYKSLVKTLSALNDDERKDVESRIMFGSDFLINLMRIESYYDYYKIFDNSPLSDEEKILFSSQNPAKFLFENDATVDIWDGFLERVGSTAVKILEDGKNLVEKSISGIEGWVSGGVDKTKKKNNTDKEK